MSIIINYKRSLELYPIETNKLISKLRSGNSKTKNSNPEQLTYEIEYTGCGDPLIKGDKNICVYSLLGKIGKWHYRVSVQNRQFVPDEILTIHTMNILTNEHEQEIYDINKNLFNLFK